MHFTSFSDFLAMGGYASYVWSGFGITFFAMAVILTTTLRKHSKLTKEISKRIAREQRVKDAEKMENTL
ncbi:heme exporter protein CcmD [Vibrio sp. SS-MA-C1-2]|uniref:heme exporter protein CcmD n=1 Tax=Vibrio sp. SS-MA-C1-2 TaxID=2908646 RepID=UPI001F3B2C51|nr:heme exporter protein CcmD [Vibrio sp. SS-MA-C1-2]UJF18747.1 heme exporter protein CcmD [Vibrio sp. SS-MA-C1-2]